MATSHEVLPLTGYVVRRKAAAKRDDMAGLGLPREHVIAAEVNGKMTFDVETGAFVWIYETRLIGLNGALAPLGKHDSYHALGRGN